MSADTTVEEVEETTSELVEERVPYDRFKQANEKAKTEADRAKKLEKQLSELAARLEDRETAGLPELEREKKAREALEKRLAEAEERAQASETAVQRSKRESWVAAAAQKLNFANPSRVARLIDDLDGIEDADGAERAVKSLAKSDPYLIKADDAQPKIGRVLEGGKTATGASSDPLNSNIDLDEEAVSLAEGLKKFLRD